MKLSEMIKAANWNIAQSEYEDGEIITAYTSDLLSDVMGNANDADLLITIQAHNNTVAVASLAGMRAIVICNGRPIPEDMILSAQKEGIAVLQTEQNQFNTSNLVGNLLK
jgi:hypothetical protein